MLQYYLGIIIDPEGNFMTFGKWTPQLDFDSPFFTITQHNLALMTAFEQKSNSRFADALLPDTPFYDTYDIFEEKSRLGYCFLVNASTALEKMIFGYFPQQLSLEAQKTILALEKDIMIPNLTYSIVFIDGKVTNFQIA